MYEMHKGYMQNRANPIHRAVESKTASNAWHNIAEPMMNIEMGMGAGKLAKPALEAAGKYLTEETALKNAYKLNPYAFKPNPESYYRMIGDEGLADLQNVGYIRSNPNTFYADKHPFFSKGYPIDGRIGKSVVEDSKYLGNNMIEVGGNNEIGNRFVKNRWADAAPDPNIFVARDKIGINNPNLKVYEKDWLKGYKEVPKPTHSEQIISRGVENPTGIRMDNVGYQEPATGELAPILREEYVPTTPAEKIYNSFFKSGNHPIPDTYIPNRNNLEDLKYAKEKFGNKYNIPENLDRIAKSDMLTDRIIRGLVNRDNTFVRGVSTNWKELERVNPEILRHLEGKGFNLTTEEGTKKAAEYMATHVPINTGYGRASLNNDIFDKGMDALYSSNSIPTGEGYTYGQGYIVKGKRPTDFTSSSRKDWINHNKVQYNEHVLPRDISKEDAIDALSIESSNPREYFNKINIGEPNKQKALAWVDDLSIKDAELRKKYNIADRGKGDYNIDHIVGRNVLDTEHSNPEISELFQKQKDNLNAYRNEYQDYKKGTTESLKNSFVDVPMTSKLHGILKTEHSDLIPESIFGVGDKDIGIKKIHEEVLPKLGLKETEYNQVKNDLIRFTEGYRNQGLKSNEISEKLKEYLKLQYSNNNPYAHYIHLGTPGEKILEPISSTKITPDIWKNKSRAHTNTYSRGLSAASLLGAIGTTTLDKKENGGWLNKYK